MKTVIDAVNELEGNLGNTYLFAESDRYLFWDDVDLDYVCSISGHWNSIVQPVCTVDEFLATVSECETNFGKCEQSYGAYRIKFGLDKLFTIPKSVNHRCSYSFTDESTPIFTQEMVDNGVLPSAGMECQTSTGIHTIKYVGKEVVVSEDSKGEEFMTSMRSALHSFKPLTPPITLIDGKAYQFEHDGLVWNGLYIKDGNSMLYSLGDPSVKLCTNIQPLTVEKK